MIAAAIYDLLNHTVGTPEKVLPKKYARADEIFTQHTLPQLAEIGDYFDENYKVLIVGCGSGVEIEWFSRRCRTVFAVDVEQYVLEEAQERSKNLKNVTCLLTDGKVLPFDDGYFDLIFMCNVCEHIIHLREQFSEFYRVLRPNGILYNTFAPLFYSPYGAHLQDALKVPWGHLIFGLRAVIEIRNRYYPGRVSASNWNEMGLNRITEKKYNNLIKSTPFRREAYRIMVSKDLPLVDRVPIFRNLFILGIRDILRK